MPGGHVSDRVHYEVAVEIEGGSRITSKSLFRSTLLDKRFRNPGRLEAPDNEESDTGDVSTGGGLRSP